MYQIILYILLLGFGILVGILLSYLCFDEIKAWRKRLTIISLICLIISFSLFFSSIEIKIPLILSLFFIIIVFLTIIKKKL